MLFQDRTRSTSARTPISLVSTVLNDHSGCVKFFQQMARQSRLPDEIVIVDGGSCDETWQFLQAESAQTRPWRLQLRQEHGCNIARGRNLAIEITNHALIASTDIGCDWDPEWLHELVQPFELDPACQAVMGSWAVRAEDLSSPWARIEYALLRQPKLVATNTSDASSRSIAFTRALWEKIGGYPEDLTLAADDMVFSLLLHRIASDSIACAPMVRCYWMRPKTLQAFCKEARRNFRGAGEAGIWPGYAWKVGGRIGAEVALVLVGITLLCLEHPLFSMLALFCTLGSISRRIVRLCPSVSIARSLGVDWPWLRLLLFEYATKVYGIFGYWAGRRWGNTYCQDCRQRLSMGKV